MEQNVGPASHTKSQNRLAIVFIILLVIILVQSSQMPLLALFPWLRERLGVFATIFLGIFIEALPFLLLGTLGSGFVEVFLKQDQFQNLFPRNRWLSALTGSLMGLVFPVCECGVIPFTRRLFSKGLPISAGISFLLASPVVNPIVIASTAAAFGAGQMLGLRVGASLLIAFIIGLVFSVARGPAEILKTRSLPETHFHLHNTGLHRQPIQPTRLQQMLVIAGDEFFEMGRYLVIGAALAAALQALVPQPILLTLGQGPVVSVLVLMLLAVVLSICSTVDAFVVLGFVGTFSPGAILAFLVFGPMVDIKSTLMYLSVFKKRAVLYLLLLSFGMSFLAGLMVNLWTMGGY
ncbi:MAG: permease [Anaerolineales bacterium]